MSQPRRGVPENRFGRNVGEFRKDGGVLRGPSTTPPTCFRCGVRGHLQRDCKAPPGGGEEPSRGPFKAKQVVNGVEKEEQGNHVYLEMEVEGINRSFLLDSGCDLTMVPARFLVREKFVPLIKLLEPQMMLKFPCWERQSWIYVWDH